jgi:hypothetical protein
VWAVLVHAVEQNRIQNEQSSFVERNFRLCDMYRCLSPGFYILLYSIMSQLQLIVHAEPVATSPDTCQSTPHSKCSAVVMTRCHNYERRSGCSLFVEPCAIARPILGLLHFFSCQPSSDALDCPPCQPGGR